ncbi:MAG: hypothetical protein LQ352_003576 [Teloschistes flavicans]|nr:MAG: hypothetical protein LQ352_003576 [Teloschistes flavicans]
MLSLWLCICIKISVWLSVQVTSLALQPRTNDDVSEPLLQADNMTDVVISRPGARDVHTPNPLTANWCHVPDADYDFLYDTRGGAELTRANVMYVISFMRETFDIMAQDEGGSAVYSDDRVKLTERNIVLLVFDARLNTRTLDELYDASSAMLLCALEKNIKTEMSGTLFLISKQERFAVVRIRKVARGEEEEAEGKNGTMASF